MVKRISTVFWKIADHDSRTACQPVSRGQPGWTQATCSPWAHTASISSSVRLSKAR